MIDYETFVKIKVFKDQHGLVCLQKVLDKSGIKIREGFRFPNTFYRSIKQPLKCNYTSFAEALCFS